nr:uncharacterized protein LOC113708327 [Coffea arabica]
MGLMDFLTLYEKGSGQKVNLAKSFFILSKKSPRGRARHVSSLTGLNRRRLPIDYLWCTLFKGRSKGIYFQPFVAKVSQRLAGWQSKLLTASGRLIIIKHVLAAMPLHTMAILAPFKLTLKTLKKLMARFFLAIWMEYRGGTGSHEINYVTQWRKMALGSNGLMTYAWPSIASFGGNFDPM